MSNEATSRRSESVLTKVKCKTVGHDWIYFRERGERRCHRCDVEEEYDVDETHADEGAQKRAERYRIRDGTLFIERYQVTAWGENAEHWDWFPTGRGPASEEHLEQLRQEIGEYFMEKED